MLFVLLVLVALFNPQQSFAIQKYDGSKTYLTLWYDHAFVSQRLAADAMIKDGFDGAFLVRTGVISNAHYMSWGQLHYYKNHGFEIVDHSITHPIITNFTAQTKLTQEILLSRTTLLSHGFKVTGYISPYDHLTPLSESIINQHYKWTVTPILHRNMYENTVSSIKHDGKNNDLDIPVLHHLGVGVPPGPPINNFTAAKFWIDKAVQDHSWIILSFHQIDRQKIPFHTDPVLFQQILAYVKTQSDGKKLVVVTPSEALGIR
jgi:hypothetical protein